MGKHTIIWTCSAPACKEPSIAWIGVQLGVDPDRRGRETRVSPVCREHFQALISAHRGILGSSPLFELEVAAFLEGVAGAGDAPAGR